MEDVFHGKLHPKGRVILPIELRRELNLDDNDPLVFRRDGSSIRIQSFEEALKEAQHWVSEAISPDTDLVADLRQFRLEQHEIEANQASTKDAASE